MNVIKEVEEDLAGTVGDWGSLIFTMNFGYKSKILAHTLGWDFVISKLPQV